MSYGLRHGESGWKAGYSRKRKMKFDELELEILVEEANKHIHELQQRNLNITKRNAISEKTCDRINAVGNTKNGKTSGFSYFNFRHRSKIRNRKTGHRTEFDFNIELVGFA